MPLQNSMGRQIYVLERDYEESFARSWGPRANFCSFAPLVSTQNTSPWFQVTWVQNILWSKVRYFSQLGDRQFIGQPGLQALQAIDTGARDSSCCCCCCFPAKVITLFRRPQWNWGTAFHENYFFFSGKKCCFSQSANYPTCFKCKHGKNLQNIQPRHFILTTQMKHFDFLMLRSLAFLNLPPFNLVCSKR